MPSHLGVCAPGSGGLPRLAELIRAGGVGVAALLPQLGILARPRDGQLFAQSIEEMARLGGVSPKTAAKARDAMEALGLVTYSVENRRGTVLHHWAPSSELHAADPKRGRFDKEYFYFPARWLYGGNWARCTPVQREVFLALATNAFAVAASPAEQWVLRDEMHPDAPRIDVERCWEYADGIEPRVLRFAIASLSELCERTGRHLSAVHAAIAGWKHPSVWHGSRNDPQALRHALIGVYPSASGSLVYHIRDHAPAWAWSVLNETTRRRAKCAKPCGVGSATRSGWSSISSHAEPDWWEEP